MFLVIDNDFGLARNKCSFLSPTLRKLPGDPSLPNLVKDVLIWEGATVTCQAHGFSKRSRVFWRELSREATRSTEYGLKIEKAFSNVAQSNSGRYFCSANDTEIGSYVSESLVNNEGKSLI